MADEPICPQCGFSVYSRTHMEGLGGIHDTPLPAPDKPSLERLNKTELLALAAERGIDVSGLDTNAKLRAALS